MKSVKKEMLNEEQMEQFSGGDCYELHYDCLFLNNLGSKLTEHDSSAYFFDIDGGYADSISSAWLEYGIRVETHTGLRSNKYFNMYGQEISRAEACNIALKFAGIDWKEYMRRAFNF